MRTKILKNLCGSLFAAAVLLACGGATSSVGTGSPVREDEVTSIVMTPTEAERKGGGQEVVIDASDAVRDWVSSEAFGASGWQKNEDQSPARYVVSFRSPKGEVARYFMGTLRGEPLAYRCFGLCETWWTAPSMADGSQDPLRYRVLDDERWHPLARQWYLSSK